MITRVNKTQLKQIIRESIVSLMETSDYKVGLSNGKAKQTDNLFGLIKGAVKGKEWRERKKRQKDYFGKEADKRRKNGGASEVHRGEVDAEQGCDTKNRLEEAKLRQKIKRIIAESLWEEDDSEDKGKKNTKSKKSTKSNDGEMERKRSEVMDWLGATENDEGNSYTINHADLVRQLWNPKDKDEEDELRGLFSKKFRHAENDNGSIYDFSDSEINTLYNIKGNLV